MEIKSGAGGEESALFASDLARMYLKYCEKRGWKAQVLGVTESDLGGYKEATISIKARESVRDGVWSWLKFEGGVHRVQRVPVTESQGRIHTSAAGVLIYPEPDEVEEVAIDESDLRIDVYRSSGKGGQGVNTTDSAVRITHLPTGIVVTCQNERSQLQNKARAMQVLAARLQAAAEEEAEAAAAQGRAAQIRTVDRSERIRTYNFPRTASPTIASATRPTTSTRCWRRHGRAARRARRRRPAGPARRRMTAFRVTDEIAGATRRLADAGIGRRGPTRNGCCATCSASTAADSSSPTT